MNLKDQPPPAAQPQIERAAEMYETWVSAGAGRGRHEPFHKLPDDEIEKWVLFSQNYVNSVPIHEPTPPADVEKYGQFDGDLYDVTLINAEISCSTPSKRPGYEQWRAAKVEPINPPWWAFWRKPVVPQFEDYELDIVAYWDWVYEQESSEEDRKLAQAQAQAEAVREAQLAVQQVMPTSVKDDG